MMKFRISCFVVFGPGTPIYYSTNSRIRNKVINITVPDFHCKNDNVRLSSVTLLSTLICKKKLLIFNDRKVCLLLKRSCCWYTSTFENN